MKKDTNTVILILLGVTAAIGFLTKYLFAFLVLSVVMIFAYEFFITNTRKIEFKHYLNSYREKKISHEEFIIKKRKIRFDTKDKKKYFILLINFLPIVLMFVTSVVTGSKIRTMWMTPFYLFFGVLILSMFDIKDDEQTFKEFFKPFLILFLLSPITYGLVSLISENKRTDYKGKVEANKVLQVWQKDFTEAINVVLGDEWHAGNISYHMEGRPVWLGEINQKNVDLVGTHTDLRFIVKNYKINN